MPRLAGTEEWDEADITQTVEFFLGCAENAGELQGELGVPSYQESSKGLSYASPLEPLTKAVALLLATDRVKEAIKILREPARLLPEVASFEPTATGRFDLNVAEFTRVALFSALSFSGRMEVNPEAFALRSESNYFVLPHRREWHYEMLAVLPVLYSSAVALRGGAETLRWFERIFSYEQETAGAFTFSESLDFRALGIYQISPNGPQESFWAPPAVSALDGAVALHQMENRYEKRLQSYRQDRYHWDLLNVEGDLIDWSLLLFEVASMRIGIYPQLSALTDTEAGQFTRSLAIQLSSLG